MLLYPDAQDRDQAVHGVRMAVSIGDRRVEETLALAPHPRMERGECVGIAPRPGTVTEVERGRHHVRGARLLEAPRGDEPEVRRDVSQHRHAEPPVLVRNETRPQASATASAMPSFHALAHLISTRILMLLGIARQELPKNLRHLIESMYRGAKHNMEDKRMRHVIVRQGRFLVVLAALVCAVGFGAGVASAQNPHFISANVTCNSSTGNLEFSWKEAGLGSNVIVNYEFGASNATITCTCVTNSGNCPGAANKVTTSAPALRTASLSSGKNGAITARNEIVTPPSCPASSAPTCGGGQRLLLSAVSYTGIHLTDTSNRIDAGVSPTGCGFTYFTCP